jgi:hypothetical protein
MLLVGLRPLNGSYDYPKKINEGVTTSALAYEWLQTLLIQKPFQLHVWADRERSGQLMQTVGFIWCHPNSWLLGRVLSFCKVQS